MSPALSHDILFHPNPAFPNIRDFPKTLANIDGILAVAWFGPGLFFLSIS